MADLSLTQKGKQTTIWLSNGLIRTVRLSNGKGMNNFDRLIRESHAILLDVPVIFASFEAVI